jgi:hypothetical protein
MMPFAMPPDRSPPWNADVMAMRRESGRAIVEATRTLVPGDDLQPARTRVDGDQHRLAGLVAEGAVQLHGDVARVTLERPDVDGDRQVGLLPGQPDRAHDVVVLSFGEGFTSGHWYHRRPWWGSRAGPRRRRRRAR